MYTTELLTKPPPQSSQAHIDAWKCKHPKKQRYAVKEPTILRDRKMFHRCVLPSFPDYAALNQLLPPPPSNKMWEKQKDGSWLLKDKEVELAMEEEEQPDVMPEFIEHTVLRSDTLMGLRLKYGVTVQQLRRHNSFFGDKFAVCPVLKIPSGNLPKGFKMVTTHATKIQILRNKASLTERQAVYYLDLHEEDLQKACEDAVADLQWEKDQTQELHKFAAGEPPKGNAKQGKPPKEPEQLSVNPMMANMAETTDSLQQPLLELA